MRKQFGFFTRLVAISSALPGACAITPPSEGASSPALSTAGTGKVGSAAFASSVCPGNTWTTNVVHNALFGGCDEQDCGLNGFWFGEGVSFRTLHLPPPNGYGGANDLGFGIVSFTAADGEPLEMNIMRDELIGTKRLIGRPPVPLFGKGLRGSKIVIGDPITGTGIYTMTIEDVAYPYFWTKCNSGDPSNECKAAVDTTAAYTFSVTNNNGDCIDYCKPGLTDDENLQGTAVMFKGDVYDDVGFTVNNGTDDSFNIACYGSVVSKQHFLRHTVAAMGTDALPVPERQAMVRLFTADYCGHGNTFTTNGHPIRLEFGPSPFHPDEEKVGFNLGMTGDPALPHVQSIEAIWRADGSGASCIGTPRRTNDMAAKNGMSPAAAKMMIIDSIKTDCKTSNPSIEECTTTQLDNALNVVLGNGDYAVSGNLFPPP